MNNDFPLVTVVTPNYNYANFISETIESVLRQDYSYIEHIIVDDGSTDNSVDVIQSYTDRYPGRIKLIQQKNLRQTPAINMGLRSAKGDIIGWINSDDSYCPNVFSKIIECFIKHHHVDIVFGDVNVVDNKGRFIYRIRHLDFNYSMGVFLGFAKITTSNAIFWRRRVMEKSGYLNAGLKCNMDGEYFSRLTYNAKVAHLSIPFANFRKQEYSKEALKNKNWEVIVKNEITLELINSYKRSKFSKILPYNVSIPVKIIIQIKRIMLRTIKLHYLYKLLEIVRYKRAILSQNSCDKLSYQ